MSSGMECSFIEPEVGKWYYVLQNWTCPVGAWDWREDATCFGPFGTFDAAQEHLHDNHSNPGGYNVAAHADYRGDETYQKLVAEAKLKLFG